MPAFNPLAQRSNHSEVRRSLELILAVMFCWSLPCYFPEQGVRCRTVELSDGLPATLEDAVTSPYAPWYQYASMAEVGRGAA